MTNATTKTIIDKLKDLFGSVRFWVVTLTAIVAILEANIGGGGMAEMLEIIKLWLITVAGIGTVDSVARKIGGSEKTVDTSSEELLKLLKTDSQK